MSEAPKPIPLRLHTLESLVDELISGRSILVDKDRGRFKLETLASRSILEWYRRNRPKWAKNVQKTDLEEITQQIEEAPPDRPVSIRAASNLEPRVLHLKSVCAHRFGGLHQYGDPHQAPEDLVLRFESPFTIIEGQNGTGKTSLLSAICWCLSGTIYRSQRPPESGAASVPVSLLYSEPEEGSDEQAELPAPAEMAPITPLPSPEVIRDLQGAPIPIDSWVELVFQNSEGVELAPIRRSLTRSSRGTIQEVAPDLSILGLDPVSIEIGTKFPGQLPYIQIGETSDLGKAVTALTGLSPLKDLAKHASRCQSRLRDELPREAKAGLQALETDFSSKLEELNALFDESPMLRPDATLPKIQQAGAPEILKSCLHHLETVQAGQLQEAQLILGEEFDPRNREVVENLKRNVEPAKAQLRPETIGRLPSAQRLASLRKLTASEIEGGQEAIKQLIADARELDRAAEEPERAARLRLYSRVGNWLREEGQGSELVEDCPVCFSGLSGKTDPVTGEEVATHLQSCVDTPTNTADKTVSAWATMALKSLRAELPEALAAELDRDLPQRPHDLLHDLFTKDVFGSSALQGSLAPLQKRATRLWEICQTELPSFQESKSPELPARVVEANPGLQNALHRLTHAIGFALWRRQSDIQCRSVFERVIGAPQAQADVPKVAQASEKPLLHQLERLQQLVETTRPSQQASSKLSELARVVREYMSIQSAIERYQKAAEALEPITTLGDLVAKQIDQLIIGLSEQMLEWRNRLYRPTVVGAPQAGTARVLPGGRLEVDAEQGGVLAPGKHIINASDLKATLLAFLLAFWEHVASTRGGLSILLFDDPQELLDRTNRKRLADALRSIVERGGQPLVTTNDPGFAEDCLFKMKAEPSVEVEHLLIHPLGAARDCVALGEDKDSIRKKLRRFLSPQFSNDNAVAREILISTRTYCEQRLGDFFDFRDSSLPSRPGLSDLLSAVSSRYRSGREPFTGPAFRSLVAIRESSKGRELVHLLNRSHHRSVDEITFGEVWQVRDSIEKLIGLMNDLHEQAEWWRRRDVVPEEPESPKLPEGIALTGVEVPVYTSLAAFSSGPMPEDSSGGEDFLDLASGHREVAVYQLLAHNFGFTAPYGALALVDLEDEQPQDGRLVIALHGDRIFARRLYRTDADPRVVCLASEAENPLERPPSLLIPAQEVRLLKVVGVLFQAPELPSRGGEEARLWPDGDVFRGVEAAFRVVGTSALPLALPEQWVLGGSMIKPADLPSAQGRIVAVSTTDGCVLKRVGEALPGAEHIRQFETIGGGVVGADATSIVARTEDVEDNLGSLPLVQSVRAILGVLYPRAKKTGG